MPRSRTLCTGPGDGSLRVEEVSLLEELLGLSLVRDQLTVGRAVAVQEQVARLAVDLDRGDCVGFSEAQSAREGDVVHHDGGRKLVAFALQVVHHDGEVGRSGRTAPTLTGSGVLQAGVVVDAVPVTLGDHDLVDLEGGGECSHRYTPIFEGKGAMVGARGSDIA